jgi:pimeloyl-ACP methyl ester carboxylesterase
LADAAGLGKAGILHHFGSKAGVMEAVIEFAIDWYRRKTLSIVKEDQSLEDRLEAFDVPGHGLADYGSLDYPEYVDVEEQVLRSIGGCELVLSHSFGGGCLVEALNNLPKELHPKRAIFMAIFSEVRWIFTVYANSLGIRPVVFENMQYVIEERTGRSLDEFDVARNGANLTGIQTLLIHDPEDQVTSFRNAERNHSNWPSSVLYTPKGAGHHLGTTSAPPRSPTTSWPSCWCRLQLEGTLPPGATTNTGNLEPMAASVSAEDLSRSGGVSDYYK